jgi:hypothetical protein
MEGASERGSIIQPRSPSKRCRAGAISKCAQAARQCIPQQRTIFGELIPFVAFPVSTTSCDCSTMAL